MYIIAFIIFILLCYMLIFILYNKNDTPTIDTDLSESDYYMAYSNNHSNDCKSIL